MGGVPLALLYFLQRLVHRKSPSLLSHCQGPTGTHLPKHGCFGVTQQCRAPNVTTNISRLVGRSLLVHLSGDPGTHWSTLTIIKSNSRHSP